MSRIWASGGEDQAFAAGPPWGTYFRSPDSLNFASTPVSWRRHCLSISMSCDISNYRIRFMYIGGSQLVQLDSNLGNIFLALLLTDVFMLGLCVIYNCYSAISIIGKLNMYVYVTYECKAQ